MSQVKAKWLKLDSSIFNTGSDIISDLISIKTGGISGDHMSSGAKQVVLESKVFAVRDAVLSLSVTGSSHTDAAFTTNVEAVSKNDTRTTAVDGSEKGVYVGLANNSSPFKVIIRANGTDNGIEDGLNDEVYGVLTWDTDHYVLSFKKSDNTDYSFSTSTSIDVYFVEFVDLYQVAPADLLLLGGVSGVIDATSANALAQDISTLYSEIDRLDGMDSGLQSVDSALSSDIAALDSDLVSEVTRLQSVDSALSSDIAALDSDLVSEVTRLQSVDSALSSDIAALDSDLVSEVARLDSIDSALSSDIAALDSDLVSEVTRLQSVDSALSSDIAALDSDLVSEVTRLQSVDSALSSDIAALDSDLVSEVTRLQSVDSALSSDITALESDLAVHLSDLDNAHSAVAISFSNISFTASDVDGALVELDAAITAVGTAAQDAIDAEANARLSDVSDLYALLGRPDGSTDLGTGFDIVSDNATLVEAISELESAITNAGAMYTESIALDASAITNAYVDLAQLPKYPTTLQLFPVGGAPQNYGSDFTVINNDSSVLQRLNWDGLGMDGVLAVSDILRVHYMV